MKRKEMKFHQSERASRYGGGAPRRSSSLTSSPLLATASDLTSTAAPFVPQQLQRPAPSSADPSESAPLVQVTRGGCIFFVPEADATGGIHEIPSQFVCMWPLDTTTSQHRNVAGSFGYPSHSYKVLSDTDGR
ncbi:hypothetical protein DYB35_011619, partial [Aphanomyces astaci]